MKKQLLLLVMMFLPKLASADYSGTCGDNLTWTLVESTGTLTISGSGAIKDYADYYNVPWFSYSGKILVVDIEKDVTSIGNYAFYYCSRLISVTIPNSVTSIGNSAFQYCSSLTSVTIPNSMTSIGSEAFYKCTSLTSVTIGNSVTIIGERTFGGCRIENVLTKNSKITGKNAFSDRTYQHAMLYIPEGTWGEAVYDGDWYMFNNIRETAMNTGNLSPSRAYTLMDTKTFGYAVYDGTNDEVKIVKAFYSIDEHAPNNCWQVSTQAGKKYIYNLGAKKYASIGADGRIILTANKTAIEIKEGDGGIIFGADTSHQWGFVKNDSHPNVTGIVPQASNSEKTANSYYSLEGQCTQSPRRGMNIVRKSDGSIIKVVMK